MDFFAFDKNYLDRLRNGDPATEHHFFTYFERLLNIKLRAQKLSLDEVENLQQETFIRTIAAMRKEGVIRQPERFAAFVNSICNNALLDHWRSSAKNTPLEDARTGSSDKAMDQEDITVTKPCADHVRDVLERMPKRDRELLGALFMDEKQTHITPPPGATLCSIAESICSKKTMEEIVCPIVADIQFEHREAFCAGRRYKATWIRVRGWWSFLVAIGVNRIRKMFVRLFLRPSSR